MSDQWFYARGGQQAGPVSFTELVALAQTGGLATNDLVWQDGTPNWRLAGDVTGLFPAGAAPAAAAAAVNAPATLTSGTPAAYAPPQQQPYPPPGMAYATPGAPQNYYGGGYGAGQSYANEARTAMIVAIIGIFCFGIVLGPIGIVLGNSAKKKMRASGNMDGEGMATAAIIIGWIIVGLAAIGILFFVLAAVLSAAGQ